MHPSGDTADVPVAPEASSHLAIPVSASEQEEPNGGVEEDHEELVVLDPEHVSSCFSTLLDFLIHLEGEVKSESSVTT